MYATADAFLLHATVSSEPMQALPWLWWAIDLALANLDEPKPRRTLGSASLMAIAYWFYQGYAVIAPGVLGVAMLAACDRPIRDSAGWPAIVRQVMLWCTCFAAGIVSLFYAAHAVVLGNTAVNDLIARMTKMAGITGSTPWAELKFGDVASSVLYGGINLIENPGFEGVRKCLTNPFDQVSIRYWGSTLLWYSVMTISAFFLWKLWPGLEVRRKRQAASIIWLLVCSFGATLVIGHYDKFWIPPLGLAIVLLWTLYGWMRERVTSGVSVMIPTLLIITVLCVEIGVNLRNALYYHLNPSPDYLAAIEIAQRVQENDLVVLNWDKAGTYFNAFYPGKARSFSVRQVAIYQSGGSPQRFASILSDELDEVARNHGRVWIIQLAAIDDAEGVSRFGEYWRTEPIRRIRRQARLEEQWDCREGNLSHKVYLHVVPGESLMTPDATP